MIVKLEPSRAKAKLTKVKSIMTQKTEPLSIHLPHSVEIIRTGFYRFVSKGQLSLVVFYFESRIQFVIYNTRKKAT